MGIHKINTHPMLAAFALWLVLTGVAGICAAANVEDASGNVQATAFIASLTAQEQAWLRAHPVIRVVQDPGWPPVEFINEQGEYVGMAGDYLALIEQMLPVKFERVLGLSWQEAYAKMQRHEIDMTTSVASTPEREVFWAFTKPYMKIPIVILTHADVTYIADMRELAGKKVAVVAGYAVTDWIPRDFPEIELVRVETVEAGLKALQRGEVFACIENMLVAGYYMARLKMTNLKIAGETPYVNAQSMAVRKDWAILAGILDKALASISEPQRNAIYRRWLPVRYEQGFDYAKLWYAVALFVAILSAMAIWTWRLSREIASRKKAENALGESEKKFKRVFESANVGKSLTLPTGEINVNETFCRMLGYSREELAGKKWQELTPQEDVETINRVLGPLLNGKQDQIRFDKRYIHKNGSYIWGDVSAVLHRDDDGHPLYFITTVVDITERKVMEEHLSKSEMLLRTVLDHLPIGVAINSVDPAVTFDYANDNFVKFYRTSREALALPGGFWDAIYENPQRREEIRARVMSDCLSGDPGRMIWEGIPILRTGEAITYINAQNTPISGAQLVLSTVWDVTEQKKVEAQIQSLNYELEQKVALRTRELRESQLALLNIVDDLNESAASLAQANQALEAVNKELSAFSYSVSHDLRAPLRSIDGFSQALLEDYSDKFDDTGRNYLGRIRRATQHMGHLIDDMLKLSRVTRAEFNLESVDLSEMVEAIAMRLKENQPHRTIELRIQDGLNVTADRNLLSIALVNLLDNALKFTSKKVRAEIVFGCVEKQGQEEYYIRDNGAGFDMAYVDKLFGTFQRLHSTDEFEGTGIGLATVKRIITRHGGTIRAEGESGKGAAFFFTIPS
jgi:PAS domain S-box-containing protein